MAFCASGVVFGGSWAITVRRQLFLTSNRSISSQFGPPYTLSGWLDLGNCSAKWRHIEEGHEFHPELPRLQRPHIRILPGDHLPQMQGVVMLKPAIDGPSSDPDRLTVVKTVDIAASKRQRVPPLETLSY